MKVKAFEHIVIFHPAAIGDAMLATPVATILKRNFQNARITYWSHESLSPVIKDMCPAVDDFVEYRRGQNIFALTSQLKSLKPDLFIDLSNAPKGKLMAFLSGKFCLRYKKRKDGIEPIRHAADNFVDTIRPIVEVVPTQLFPTICPTGDSVRKIIDSVLPAENGRPIIAVAPGVGRLRPNRAWTPDGFCELIELINSRDAYAVAMIGGSEEVVIATELQNRCSEIPLINLCGTLTLAQTASFLKGCSAVVSADTGPAHIAVAVGTPVVGLYGPTALTRSGPYGYLDFAVDKRDECKCQYKKHCTLTNEDTAGVCMSRITAMMVYEQLKRILSNPRVTI